MRRGKLNLEGEASYTIQRMAERRGRQARAADAERFNCLEWGFGKKAGHRREYCGGCTAPYCFWGDKTPLGGKDALREMWRQDDGS